MTKKKKKEDNYPLRVFGPAAPKELHLRSYVRYYLHHHLTPVICVSCFLGQREGFSICCGYVAMQY